MSERTMEVIKSEYQSLCAEIGDATRQIKRLNKQRDELYGLRYDQRSRINRAEEAITILESEARKLHEAAQQPEESAWTMEEAPSE